MSKFNIPTRFDNSLANDGVWFDVYDEFNNHYGKFLCALIDKHSQRTVKAYERINKRYQRLKNTPGYKEKAAADIFVELSLMDWELKGTDGKAIPYSRDDAVEYLVAAPFVLDKLDQFASDVTNYAAEAVEPAVKN